jgi:hypothetical protein
VDFSIFLRPWDRYRAEEVLKATRLPALRCESEEGMVVIRLAKKVVWISLSILCFPWGIYQLLHRATRTALMSASLKHRTDVIRFAEYWPLDALAMSQFVFSVFILRVWALFRPESWISDRLLARDRSLDRYFEHSRFVVNTDDAALDALFLRQQGIQSFDRILLYCCSEAELAEGNLYNKEVLTLARKIKAHVVLWNYPGIASSTGASSRANMVDAYRKVLHVVEKKMGAKQIVTYGHSMGASVAMEGLSRYRFNPNTYHMMVARSTLSTTAQGISAEYGRLAGYGVRALGWNFNNVASLAKIPGKCLVVQTAAVAGIEELERREQIVPDGAWNEPEASLGYALLSSAARSTSDRPWKVLGIREGYGATLNNRSIALLAREIHAYFPKPWWRVW